jgi:hypothetical protein
MCRSTRILTLDFYIITVVSRVCYVNGKIQAVGMKFLERKLECECGLEGRQWEVEAYLQVQSVILWRGSEENHRKTHSLCSVPRLQCEPRNIFIWIWSSNLQPWCSMFSWHWILRFRSSGCEAIQFGKQVSTFGNLLPSSLVYLKI